MPHGKKGIVSYSAACGITEEGMPHGYKKDCIRFCNQAGEHKKECLAANNLLYTPLAISCSAVVWDIL
jgi:hypothetical protein